MCGFRLWLLLLSQAVSISDGKDMPVMIFNNQFGSCYRILGKTFAVWMWQGCNASCRDQGLVLFTVTVIVKDGRQNMAYD